MPHLLIAGKLHGSGFELLDQASGITLDYVEEVSEDSYVSHIDKADGLIIRTQPLTAATVARAARLKIVSRHGVGYDAVDVNALNARGIPLTIVGDVNSISVAEHVLMLMLAASKRLVRADTALRKGDWQYRDRLESRDLNGKTLLIIGYGRIGRRLAGLAAALGMNVVAYDPFLDAGSWPAGPARQTSDLMQALASADVVSTNMPKSEQPIIGEAQLAVMKPSAIIVNTARGGIVDEIALAAALHEGKIGAAGLDVFEEEPLAAGHPLLPLNQAVLTPHIAGLSQECAARMAVSCVQNVLDFFAGRLDPALVVNRTSVQI